MPNVSKTVPDCADGKRGFRTISMHLPGFAETSQSHACHTRGPGRQPGHYYTGSSHKAAKLLDVNALQPQITAAMPPQRRPQKWPAVTAAADFYTCCELREISRITACSASLGQRSDAPVHLCWYTRPGHSRFYPVRSSTGTLVPLTWRKLLIMPLRTLRVTLAWTRPAPIYSERFLQFQGETKPEPSKVSRSLPQGDTWSMLAWQ